MSIATKVVRLPAVVQHTGLSRSTIYALIKAGSFPAPISLGARAVGWLVADVQTWLDSRVAMSRETANDRKR